jgi:hypothetical protein
MSRYAIGKSAALFVLAVFLFTMVSCIKITEPANNTPQNLATPSYPTIAVAGESDTMRWDAVSGAASYILYYTTDGTYPTTSSASIAVPGGVTYYVHTSLNPTLTYTYALQAVGHGRTSSISTASWGEQPLPMIHATFTFNDYAYGDVGFMYFQVDGSYVPINSTKKTIAGYADAYGSTTFDVTFDHTNYWGYTVFKDMDANGLLSTGDTVWGDNTSPGYCGFLYWSSVFTSSKTFTTAFDSDSVFLTPPHVY